MKKYFYIYLRILKMMLAVILEYRLNTIVQGAFTLVYFAGLYFILQVMFTQTSTLGGWTKPELLVLLTVAAFSWGWIEEFYFEALRKFMTNGVRTGELDKVLVKPVNTAWFVGFSSPQIYFTLHQLILGGFLFYQFISLKLYLHPTNIFLFLVTASVSFLVLFLIFSTYATLAFYITNSSQAIRTLQTISDQAHYPTLIYPRAIEGLMYTLIPVAFVGYIPTVFLLGKGSLRLLIFISGCCFITYYLHRLAWREGLKRYSSASS